MWWLPVISAAKKIPWPVYAGAGLFVAFFLTFKLGQHDRQKDWDASIAKGKVIVEQLKKDAKKINTVIDTQWHERTEYIYVKGDTIVKEIPKYIPVDTPDLPGGFRVLHDAAATSTVPGSSSGIEAAPVRVKDAAETITVNYTQCLVWREEVVAWRQWYSEQSHLWQTATRK